MLRRSLFLLPAALLAVAIPAAPALAGEEDDGDDGTTPASATLQVSQGCVSRDRAVVFVSGRRIDTVTFLVDGRRITAVSRPNSAGDFILSMRCTRVSAGAHRARAVVRFTPGSRPLRRTLSFRIIRRAQQQQTSPHFTG